MPRWIVLNAVLAYLWHLRQGEAFSIPFSEVQGEDLPILRNLTIFFSVFSALRRVLFLIPLAGLFLLAANVELCPAVVTSLSHHADISIFFWATAVVVAAMNEFGFIEALLKSVGAGLSFDVADHARSTLFFDRRPERSAELFRPSKLVEVFDVVFILGIGRRRVEA